MPTALNQLLDFTALDQDALQRIVTHAGWQSAACYIVNSNSLIRVLESAAERWPVTVALDLDYTPNSHSFPLGWLNKNDISADKKIWPKNTTIYFPEQFQSNEIYFFAIQKKPGSRTPFGCLNGLLESVRRRITVLGQHIEQDDFVAQQRMKERWKQLDLDFENLLNHEFRTPLAVIRGYAALLSKPEKLQHGDMNQFVLMIDSEVNNALVALERMNLVFQFDELTEQRTQVINVVDLFQNLVADKNKLLEKLRLKPGSPYPDIDIVSSDKVSAMIAADRDRIELAIREVLSNAVGFSSRGKVRIDISASGNMVVIDVIDDGKGVSKGNEELIFQNFFRDPSSKIGDYGKRGMGVGLYLARKVIEQHGGRLSFVRTRGRKGHFRLVIPCEDDLQSSA